MIVKAIAKFFQTISEPITEIGNFLKNIYAQKGKKRG